MAKKNIKLFEFHCDYNTLLVELDKNKIDGDMLWINLEHEVDNDIAVFRLHFNYIERIKEMRDALNKAIYMLEGNNETI